MTGVDDLGALNTFRAVVPVRAVQALVTNTVDELVAAVADCRMACIPAGRAQSIGQGRQGSVQSGSLESMAWVMTVLVADMAVQAQIVVIARGACDKVLLRENWGVSYGRAG
jgi:hypothetical protein